MKVIKILNNYQIIIDAGSLEGLEYGMRVSIFEKGEEIELEDKVISIDKLKKTLVVSHVDEDFSILEHPESYTKISRGAGALTQALMVNEVIFGREKEYTVEYTEDEKKLFNDKGNEKILLRSEDEIKLGDIAKIT